MDPELARNLVIFVAVLAVAAVALVALLPTVFKHLVGRGSGGWSKLAARFPATQPPPAVTLSRQSVQVGQILYRNCVAVAFLPQGLYLARRAVLPGMSRPPAVLVPWSELSYKEEGRLFWQRADILNAGVPPVTTITLLHSLFISAEPYFARRVVA